MDGKAAVLLHAVADRLEICPNFNFIITRREEVLDLGSVTTDQLKWLIRDPERGTVLNT